MTGTKNGARKTLKGRINKILPDFKVLGAIAGIGLALAFLVQRKLTLPGVAGAFFVCTVLLFIFYRDILRYKPKFARETRMLILLGLLIAGTMLLGRFSAYVLEGLARGFGRQESGVWVYGVPLAAGAMLVTLLFDFHTAIFFSFSISLLAGIWMHDASYSFFAFVGSLTAAFGAMASKKRASILRAGFLVMAANLVTITAVYLLKGQSSGLHLALGFGAFSALYTAATVLIILPILEYAFKVTTDIRLLELLDLDQPLMKSLMVSAPGTYHHSIIVGNLVESVAEAVGANPLLARVAAYYHDIGKLKMPDYFVENNPQSVSRHEKLTPHMSSMILVSHVKEGVELANESKLPKPIIEVIEQHHGSSIITYFYQKAKGLEREDDLSETDYRYHGPKPQTRVAALVMMADAVEAASRVLHDPTPQRIRNLVDKIIDHIYLEGQLDECELTLKDIYEIKKRFTHILTGILHKRVDYPGFEFDDKDQSSPQKQSKEDKAKHERDKAGFPAGPQLIRAGRG